MEANPRGPVQLVSLPRVDDVPTTVEAWIDRVTAVHSQVAANLLVSYEKCKD